MISHLLRCQKEYKYVEIPKHATFMARLHVMQIAITVNPTQDMDFIAL